MSHELTQQPKTDPTNVYRYRDGLYAEDMLIVGIVWLDLFTWLAANPSDVTPIMRHFNTTLRPTDVMLTLFVAMGLLEQSATGAYQVTPVAREHLCADSPWFLGPYYASLKDRPVCKDLLNVLRTGKPANWGSERDKKDWHKSMETEEFAKQFTAAMDCRGVYLAQAAAKKLNLENKALLDIAGGSGIYACSLCAHFPQLRVSVLEKPPVDEITAKAVAKRGFSERVSVIASDMLAAPLPGGFDVHLFSNVLHDWDVAVVEQLIQKSFAALAPGGTLVIHDAHLNEDKSGPLHVAEYSVMLMHSTEGRCYSVAEMTSYLRRAGFANERFVETAAARSIITAEKSRA